MNGSEFVEVIKLAVRAAALTDTISNAESPPGRTVSKERKECSNWLKSLNDVERKMLEKMIEDAVDNAIFGVFCVIDGVRAVEDGPNKGAFELRYINNGLAVALNPASGPMLHDLYNTR